MSKTDKTTPWRVVEKRGGCRSDKCAGGYPCKHFSSSGSLKVIKGEMRGSERARVRAALSQGVDEFENVPIEQSRHRALWDLS